MKMTKKILLGAAALFATVAFVSCGGAAEEDGIMKVGESVTFDKTNTAESLGDKYQEGQTYRMYLPTKLKHAGGLVKVTFDQAGSKEPGVLGFIFDLKANAEDKNANDFFIIGLRVSDKADRDSNYYVSKFSNVTDFNAENFGTKLTSNPAVEKPYNDPNGKLSKLKRDMPTDEDGNKFAYIYVIANDDGSFDWKILDDKVTEKTKKLSDKEFKALTFGDEVLASGTIPAADTGYTKQTQGKLSAYAGVYDGATLVGQMDYIGTFKEADFVEE